MSPFGSGKQLVSAMTAHPADLQECEHLVTRNVYLNQGSFRSSQVGSA
jgi:hypothetical protein